jgi:hypothetical protein
MNAIAAHREAIVLQPDDVDAYSISDAYSPIPRYPAEAVENRDWRIMILRREARSFHWKSMCIESLTSSRV